MLWFGVPIVCMYWCLCVLMFRCTGHSSCLRTYYIFSIKGEYYNKHNENHRCDNVFYSLKIKDETTFICCNVDSMYVMALYDSSWRCFRFHFQWIIDVVTTNFVLAECPSVYPSSLYMSVFAVFSMFKKKEFFRFFF